MKVQLIERVCKNGQVKNWEVCSIIDKILQKQLCFLLEPYYEAKFPQEMYGFRHGRNALQAVAYLKNILKHYDKNYFSLALINVEDCFKNISHEDILTYFYVPKIWKPLLIRWLKTKVINEKGIVLEKINKGLLQSLLIGPLISNVLITNAFFKKNSKVFKWFTIKGLAKEIRKAQQKQVWNIIFYENEILLISTNSGQLKLLLSHITRFLNIFGLNLLNKQIEIITSSVFKKLKFKFLGFIFYYVPKDHIKKGGILTNYKQITFTKKVGTYLVYPCSIEFRNIKYFLKNIIKLLLRKSVHEVLKKLNFFIWNFTNYFSWSHGFSRLKSLDGLLFRYFKKYLIRKFRNRGIRRPTWVAKEFLICKSFLKNTRLQTFRQHFYLSPFGLRWHPHCTFLDKTKNSKKVIFLTMATKCLKVLPIVSATIPLELQRQPYFLMESEFALKFAFLKKKRINLISIKK